MADTYVKSVGLRGYHAYKETWFFLYPIARETVVKMAREKNESSLAIKW